MNKHELTESSDGVGQGSRKGGYRRLRGKDLEESLEEREPTWTAQLKVSENKTNTINLFLGFLFGFVLFCEG